MVEAGRRLLAVEAKWTDRPRHADTAGLRAFLEEHPRARAGLLVHAGDRIRILGERIAAVPWWKLA